MESTLEITTIGKRIPIVRDGARVGELVFSPEDVVFAEKFYRMYGELQGTFANYQMRAILLEKDTALDGNKLPVNLGERIALAKEACVFAYEQIDILFGAGTSAMLFGDTFLVSAIEQFLRGVQPHIQQARVEKIQKYTNKRPKRK
jgi:hypothetical protein